MLVGCFLYLLSMWKTSRDEPAATLFILSSRERNLQTERAYHNEPFTKEDYAEAATAAADNLKH